MNENLSVKVILWTCPFKYIVPECLLLLQEGLSSYGLERLKREIRGTYMPEELVYAKADTMIQLLEYIDCKWVVPQNNPPAPKPLRIHL